MNTVTLTPVTNWLERQLEKALPTFPEGVHHVHVAGYGVDGLAPVSFSLETSESGRLYVSGVALSFELQEMLERVGVLEGTEQAEYAQERELLTFLRKCGGRIMWKPKAFKWDADLSDVLEAFAEPVPPSSGRRW